MYNLDPRDWKIVNFIQEHPACSQSDVVRMMSDEASRMTVLNKLDRLEAEKIIIARKDKRNSQIWKLFVNENDLLVIETHQLATFGKALSKLLDRIETKREEIALWYKTPPVTEILQPHNLIYYIYSSLVALYSAKSILEWPNKIKDEQVLRNLYETVFRQLFDIQRTISEELRILQPELRQSKMVESILQNHDLLDPYKLDIIVQVFERFKLLDAVTPVIDSLWQSSSPFFGGVTLNIKSREMEKRSNSKVWNQRFPNSNLWRELEKDEVINDWKEVLRIWRLIHKKDGRG